MKHPDMHRLMADGQPEEALAIADAVLAGDYDDIESLFVLGQFYVRQENYPLAHVLFRRVSQLQPSNPSVWSNIGMCLVSLGDEREAVRCFEKALSINPDNPGALANMALIASNDCDYTKALGYCNRLLNKQHHIEAQVTRSFVNLALGNWAEGWDDYSAALQTKFRIDIDYGLPRWDGRSNARVIVHGEQGLGDEIMYASCIADLGQRIGHGNIILDVDHRLSAWFRRAFPHAAVYGDRRADERPWLADAGATHSIAIGELPRFFRRGGPTHAVGYLTPNPELKRMYTALQADGKPERRIGLCWSGGTKGTKQAARELDDESIRNLMRAFPDARFFSLEYNADQAKRGVPMGIAHHHFAVGAGSSYDHTAAYIAALDLVVGTDTTAHHAAGAMGVPSIMLVGARPLWINSDIHGDRHGWYDSVQLFRQRNGESWRQTTARFAQSQIPQLEDAA